VGAYFVQTAYSVGPPDLVIAGLTVIDPMVAVLIGLIVLQEAATAPWPALVGFAIAGAIAVYGVISLARNHPQVVSDSQEIPIQRGSTGEGDSHPSTGSIRLTEAVAKVWPDPPVHDDDPPRHGRGDGSLTQVQDDAAVAHAPRVAGRGRRSRYLDLGLPLLAGVLGGRPPHGVESRPDA
jgi:hypothetical protein